MLCTLSFGQLVLSFISAIFRLFTLSLARAQLNLTSLLRVLLTCFILPPISFNSLSDICWTFIQLEVKPATPLFPFPLLGQKLYSSLYLLNFGIRYCIIVHTENVRSFFSILTRLVHYAWSFSVSLTKNLLSLESIALLVQTHISRLAVFTLHNGFVLDPCSNFSLQSRVKGGLFL